MKAPKKTLEKNVQMFLHLSPSYTSITFCILYWSGNTDNINNNSGRRAVCTRLVLVASKAFARDDDIYTTSSYCN